MYNRPWERITNFYSRLVNGKFSSLSSALSLANNQCIVNQVVEVEMGGGGRTECRSGRWERATFKIVLSYNGASFDGWQKQPGLNTVQSILERSVGRFVDERKAQKLKDQNLPLEGNIVVAGRTDKGVTALNQVCSFYTWRTDVQARDVEDAINEVAPGKLRVISVLKVSRDFHPNFTAKWRRYLYIFTLNDGHGELCNDLVVEDENNGCKEQRHTLVHEGDAHLEENGGGYSDDDDSDESESQKKPRNFSIQKLNQILFQLQGKSLSYRMFARDTKASRSTGPPTECIIYHVRATEATIPYDNQVLGEGGENLKAVCIELVANRFLRRMVRVLVATSIREAAARADDDALLKLMDATCRRATAPPAPPEGLCLVDVGYSEFNPKNSLIP